MLHRVFAGAVLGALLAGQFGRVAADADVAALAGEFADIPGGTFMMGCSSGDASCEATELPARQVTVQPFRMGKYEITFAQWDACVMDGGCQHRPEDAGWGRKLRPVINVSFEDVEQYIAWLNGKTQQNFRLPTEAEWEYAARAGSVTKYPWGEYIGQNNANCSGCGSEWSGWLEGQTAPVGSFEPNAFGLYDMLGNVWEWTADCWHDNHEGAPADGTARTCEDSSRRVTRGGSWNNVPRWVRVSVRGWAHTPTRLPALGFRLVQGLQ